MGFSGRFFARRGIVRRARSGRLDVGMNQPNRADQFVLPEGERKLSYERDTKVENAGTFVLQREDHTLGNLLRMCVASSASEGAMGGDGRERLIRDARRGGRARGRGCDGVTRVGKSDWFWGKRARGRRFGERESLA